uniref:Amino acid transporter transmembrane domain-containing protein n=1 Tax=Hanusia phi TaxID=3032 RepID=A0A7S0ELE7_9CRYP
MTWGSSVNQIVILNLNSSAVVVLVKACLCVDLFFTFPIVIYPALEMIERALDVPNDVESVWPRNCLRFCIVCLTAFIALLIPYFALLTDIFAGLGQTLLAFVVPPLLVVKLSESSLFSPRQNSLMWTIIIFGVSACVVSTVTSIHHILKH